MTTRGGKRPGAGRPRGAVNKTSAEMKARAAASGLLPHEFLLAVARGETIGEHVPTFAERVDAAAKAAPYFAPRLAAVDATVERVEPDIAACETAEELRELIADKLRGAGYDVTYRGRGRVN